MGEYHCYRVYLNRKAEQIAGLGAPMTVNNLEPEMFGTHRASMKE